MCGTYSSGRAKDRLTEIETARQAYGTMQPCRQSDNQERVAAGIACRRTCTRVRERQTDRERQREREIERERGDHPMSQLAGPLPAALPPLPPPLRKAELNSHGS